MLYKVVLTFESVDEILPKVWPFKWKLLSMQYFPVVLLSLLYKMVLTKCEFVDEIQKCDHSD